MIRATRRSQTESPLSCTGKLIAISGKLTPAFPGTFAAGSLIGSQAPLYGDPLSVMPDSV